MDKIGSVLKAIADFVRALGPAGVAMLVVLVLLVVLGYGAYEMRLALAQEFFGSPFAMTVGAGAVSCLLAVVAFGKRIAHSEQMAANAATRVEQATRDREAALQWQIDQLRTHSNTQEQRLQSLQTQNNAQAEQLTQCHRDHAQALAQVAQLATVVAQGQQRP